MPEDIRIALTFKNNRKRKKLHKRLGAEGVLSLIDLWLSVAENRPSGILTGYSINDIEIDANWSGKEGELVDVLLEYKFIDEDNGVFEMHNWAERQSWVFASEDRSDKARFSRMAKTHVPLYEELKEQGVNAISKKEYIKLTNTQRNVNETLTESKRVVKEAVTPAPAPSPIVNIKDKPDSKESGSEFYKTFHGRTKQKNS